MASTPALYAIKILLLFMGLATLPNTGLGQTLNPDSIPRSIEVMTDEKDFACLYDFLSFDLEISDSTKLVLAELAAMRSEAIGEDYYYAKFTFRQSIIHTTSGNFSKGLDLANESLEIFLKQEEYLEVSSCYNTIGSSLAARGDLQTGKEYLQKAMQYSEMEKTDPFYDRRTINFIVYANILRKMNLLDSAYIITKQALVVSQENEIQNHEIFCLVNLGGIQKGRGEYGSAKGYLAQAIQRLVKTNMQDVRAAAYNHLVDIAIIEGQADSAFFFLQQGLEACKASSTFLPIQLELLSKLAKWYADNSLSDLAYGIQLEHLILKDSFFSLEKEKEIELVQSQFESREKDRDIQLLSQQNTIQSLQIKQRNQALAIVLIVVTSLMSIGFFFYRSKTNKRKQLQAELLQQTRESELKVLKSQMNPHFIFNALNSIQEYIMHNDRKIAGKYLGKFADLMRMYLDNSSRKSITLREELEALYLYLELEELRFESTFTYEVDVDSDTDLEAPIPSMFIQPHVENAIKHGLLHRATDRRLLVSVYQSDDNKEIVCTIEDNGVGREKSKAINQMRTNYHKPFATSANARRLELLNLHRKIPIKQEIIDLKGEQGEAGGTLVKITIPVDDREA